MKANKAVLLDRDGVINRERGTHTWELSEFEILPDVLEAIVALRGKGYVVAVITNQSGIGLGLYGHEDVALLHAYLHRKLKELGTELSDVFYCPHHPTKGKCLCRKPGGLLLERVMARHDVDPTRSCMIGDRDRDVDAASSVGVRGILVEANGSLLQVLTKEGIL